MLPGIVITARREDQRVPDRNQRRIYLSHARNVQLAMMKRVRMNTSRTVPGQIVIRVLKTNLVLNLIRLKAPMLLDDASADDRCPFACERRTCALTCEQFAMQEHHAADQIESKEHRQRQENVNRDARGLDLRMEIRLVRHVRRPHEFEFTGNGMNGTNYQREKTCLVRSLSLSLHAPSSLLTRHFDGNLEHPLPCHRYSPIVQAVINHEQLEEKDRKSVV